MRDMVRGCIELRELCEWRMGRGERGMGRDKESIEGYEKGYEERGEWGDVYAKGEGAWREGHVKGNGENCERGMGRGEERMIEVLNDRRRTVMDICIWEGRWRRGAYEGKWRVG